jgi:branched-chain amino acid transport system permease protein
MIYLKSKIPNLKFLALVGLLLAFPLVAPPYPRSLMIEVLIFAIFAMSLDLLMGYTGLVSFGHAAFFGLGSYVAAYAAMHLSSNLLVTVPLLLLVVGVAAFVIGFFALRTSGVYFLMLTLAFAQMLFSLAIKWSDVTGGSDGLRVERPHLGIGGLALRFGPDMSFYYLALALFLFCWWFLARLVASPFGYTLRGIRENETRMRALGYHTARFKIGAFVIAGQFAGLAGMLLAGFNRHAAPENLYWTRSGEAIIMVLVGGAGSLVGPILGAALVHLLPSYASSYTDRWQTILGLVFIGFVLFAPRGIYGLLRPTTDHPFDYAQDGRPPTTALQNREPRTENHMESVASSQVSVADEQRTTDY